MLVSWTTSHLFFLWLTKHSAMMFLTLFFESVCFPTIVALGIRGLGRHYKRGSGFIVGGVVGMSLPLR